MVWLTSARDEADARLEFTIDDLMYITDLEPRFPMTAASYPPHPMPNQNSILRPAAASSSSANVATGSAFFDDDELVPLANVSRVISATLPACENSSRAAKVNVQHCITEFIGCVTGEAEAIAKSSNERVVTVVHVRQALEKLSTTCIISNPPTTPQLPHASSPPLVVVQHTPVQDRVRAL